MGVSRAAAAENRARVLDVAGRLFREKGFDGIGVNDLMQAAGLTRGGFYATFESKEDLAVQASTLALAGGVATLTKVADGSPAFPFVAVVQFYLTMRHRARPDLGCPLAALGADAARAGSALKAVFTVGLESHIDLLERILPDYVVDERRKKATAAMALLAGALTLSRSVDDNTADRVLEGAEIGTLTMCGVERPVEHR